MTKTHLRMDTATSPSPGKNQPLTYDLQAVLGQPITLTVAYASSGLLHWHSQEEAQPLATGDFLQPPGLPIQTIPDSSGRSLNDLTDPGIQAVADRVSPLAFEILQAASVSKGCHELALSAPLLFTLLVLHAKDRQYGSEAFAELCALRRHDALQAIGLPAARNIARLLARTTMGAISLRLLRAIPTLTADESLMRLLRHTPELHTNHFDFLVRLPVRPWPGLLSLIDSDSSRRHMSLVAMLASDTSAMVAGNAQRLAHISDFETLQAFHDRLVARINEEDQATKAQHLEALHGRFPQPPVPGNNQIVPLTAWLDLLEEGQMMHHCVAIHAGNIGAEQTFVYRMLAPERLTLALEKQQGEWRVKEMKGRFNQLPSQNATERVYRWLEQSGS